MLQYQLPLWFKQRGYAHFDERPAPGFASAYVSDPARVASHAFWPFIRFVKKSPRYGRNPQSGKRSLLKMKERPISYAAHLDSHIFSKYAADLSALLEARYSQPFGASVLAYRRFAPPQNNVHFAMSAFDEIRERGQCDVVTIDVEDFFGSLDHARLKASWISIVGTALLLPRDHYAVYRAISSYSWIDRKTLKDTLGRDIPRRRTRSGHRVCSPGEFRALVRPKLVKNLIGKGIPQGSPISAVLANLYMADTDEQLYAELIALGGTYRRYSDDILVICPPGQGVAAEKLVSDALAEVSLSLQPTKTMRVAFRAAGSGYQGFKLGGDGTGGRQPLSLHYLGLIWDGRAVRLRSTTVARFLRRMISGVHGAQAAAVRTGALKLFRRKLYRRFSQLGRSARIFGPQPVDGPHNRNFVHYGIMAARVSGSIALRRQVGRQWVRLEAEIAKAEGRLRK